MKRNINLIDILMAFVAGCLIMALISRFFYQNKIENIIFNKSEIELSLKTSCVEYGLLMSIDTAYSKGNGCFVMDKNGKTYPKNVYERLIGNTIYQNIRQMTTSQNTNLNKVECQ